MASSETPLSKAQQLKEEGNALYSQKDYFGATAKFKQSLECFLVELLASPNSAEYPQDIALATVIHTNTAAAFLKIRRWSEAIHHCCEALHYNSSWYKALLRRGIAFYHLCIFQSALEDLNRALELVLSEEGAESITAKAIQKEIETVRTAMAERPQTSVQLSYFTDRLPPPLQISIVASIPRVAWGDPRALEYINRDQPVVLVGSPLVREACVKWTFEYLAKEFGDKPCDVFSADHFSFRYFDESKNSGQWRFRPQTTKVTMKFSEFVSAVHRTKMDNNPRHKYYYLQQALYQEVVSPSILQDTTTFLWPWVLAIQNERGYGRLKSNVLWVGSAGVVTPAHFDEAHNFFAQIYGRKRFVLLSPDQFGCMYPFPLSHPCDRQSQVDFYAQPGSDKALQQQVRFPRAHLARGIDTILETGDVLYLPPYWWHHVESKTESIGINFWFEMGKSEVDMSGGLTLPLTPTYMVAVRRNVERLVGHVVLPKEIGKFFVELGESRFDFVEEEV